VSCIEYHLADPSTQPHAVGQRKRAQSPKTGCGVDPMKGKTARSSRPGRDYAMIAAMVAIFLSVAVMLGLFTAIRDDLSQARISRRG